MDAKNLFLAQHAAVQSAAVGGNPASAAERAFAGLSDEQMRVRPREDLNSLAWLMWHIARAEDIMVNTIDKDWGGEIAAPSLQKAATDGAFGARAGQMVKAFTGRPRAAVLSGIALFHPAGHLGEAVTVRSAGGFGTGI